MSGDASEFRRGWPVLAAAFLGMATGISSLYFYSLGIFIKPMAMEFGWSRGGASLGALVGTAAAALAAVPTGRLTDRLGAKPVALVSLALLACAFAILGLATRGLTSFLILTFVISLVTCGSSPVTFTRLVVASFARSRGLALGIVLAGTGAGAILIPTLLTPMSRRMAGGTAIALATTVIVTLPVVAILLARCAGDVRTSAAAEAPLAEIARNPAFALMIATFLLAATAILGAVVQFVPMLSDWGMNPAAAGGVTALIGVAAIGGRLVAGMLLDRAPAWAVTMLLFLAAAAGLLTLGLVGRGFAAPGALVTGLAVGGEVDLISFLVARHFAPHAYGKAYGAIYASFLVGGAIGPALSGFLKDATGGYRASLLVAALLLCASAMVASRLRRVAAWRDRAAG